MASATLLTLTVAVRNGNFASTPEQKRRVSECLAGRDGKDVELTISRPVKARTKNQNSYMWGVVYKALAEASGNDDEDIHTAMKEKFLGRQFIMVGDEEYPVPKSTKTLTTQEMEVYLHKIRAFAASFGIVIPLPNGQVEESFEGASHA